MEEPKYTREPNLTGYQAAKVYLKIVGMWALYWLIVAFPIGLFAKLFWVLLKLGWSIL